LKSNTGRAEVLRGRREITGNFNKLVSDSFRLTEVRELAFLRHEGFKQYYNLIFAVSGTFVIFHLISTT
jgi:hypothetical protein